MRRRLHRDDTARGADSAPPFERKGRLFWRIYRHGALVLVSTALLLGALAWIFREQSPWARTPERLAASLERELSADRADPTRLGKRLEDFAYLLHLDIAVYHRDGHLVATSGAPPEPLSAAEAQTLDGPVRAGLGPLYAAPLGPDAYLITRWRGHEKGVVIPWVFGALLLLLAVVSWPLARKIARPLERIAATARALGAGDLDARTGLRGRGEVAGLARAIDEMAERLARLRAHEKSLMANVSHELRTPLARIRVGLEWAEEEGALPAPLAGLGIDLAELESLVEDILAAARLDLEEGGFVLRPQSVRVAHLIATAADAFARRHPHTPLSHQLPPESAVDSDTSPDAPAAGELACDPRLIGRVLINLLDNAARHGAGTVELAVERADSAWCFSVLDRGPGVAAADLARLFDAFFRTDQSRTKATGGTGLGLTLCKRIVEAHGGTLTAEPREGGGMRFQFRLPA